MTSHLSVEDLALQSGVGVPDLAELREAIADLQVASEDLDDEKEEAEKALRDILDKLPHGNGHCHHRSAIWRKVATWIKSVYGVRDSNASRPVSSSHDVASYLSSDEELEQLPSTYSSQDLGVARSEVYPRCPEALESVSKQSCQFLES